MTKFLLLSNSGKLTVNFTSDNGGLIETIIGAPLTLSGKCIPFILLFCPIYFDYVIEETVTKNDNFIVYHIKLRSHLQWVMITQQLFFAVT